MLAPMTPPPTITTRARSGRASGCAGDASLSNGPLATVTRSPPISCVRRDIGRSVPILDFELFTGPRRATVASMPLLDTSMAALERQRETFRRMTPEQRLAMAAEMSDEIRAVTEAGIRGRHPEYSDDQVRAELVGILLGPSGEFRGRPRRIARER